MAFGRKRELIQTLKPDLLILQECSQADVLKTEAPFKLWVGTNKHKGLGIIGFAEHDYKIDESYTNDLPWFIPLQITDIDLQILAVWACVKTPQLRHVRVTHAAIDHYQQFIRNAPTIVAGDFNSNTIWDKLHSNKTHSLVVERLHNFGLESLYHYQTHEQQGLETTPTLYMYRNPEKGYHIDFMFVKDSLLARSLMEIGKPESWLSESDHMPVVMDVNL